MKNRILDYFGDEGYYKGKIVAIKYFYFEPEALIYDAQLRAHGIKSFTSNTNTITAFPLGNAGIGLHVREIDQDKALTIVRALDDDNLVDAQDVSFYDADQEDIAYERKLSEKTHINNSLLIWFLVLFSLILIRAYMRANGLVLWGDSF